MSYNLFLDDIREPHEVGNYMNPVELRAQYRLEEWVIARNYSQFVQIIEEDGLPDKISFDHDLADEHYGFSNGPFKEKTGFHCAQWLCDYILDNSLSLPSYFCHSMNPVGRENILNYLDNFKKHSHEK